MHETKAYHFQQKYVKMFTMTSRMFSLTAQITTRKQVPFKNKQNNVTFAKYFLLFFFILCD